jgi:hypothetical protein
MTISVSREISGRQCHYRSPKLRRDVSIVSADHLSHFNLAVARKESNCSPKLKESRVNMAKDLEIAWQFDMLSGKVRHLRDSERSRRSTFPSIPIAITARSYRAKVGVEPEATVGIF